MVKKPPANARDLGLIPGWGRSPGKEMATNAVFLPGKFHGQRSLVGYSPWGRKRVRHGLATKQQRHPEVGLLDLTISISNFSRNCHIVSQSGCTVSRSQEQYTRVLKVHFNTRLTEVHGPHPSGGCQAARSGGDRSKTLPSTRADEPHESRAGSVEAAARTWEYWTKADLPTHWYPGVAIDSMVACSQTHSYSSRVRNA